MTDRDILPPVSPHGHFITRFPGFFFGEKKRTSQMNLSTGFHLLPQPIPPRLCEKAYPHLPCLGAKDASERSSATTWAIVCGNGGTVGGID